MTVSADRPTPANFVLVHGAWHGGWCYGRVAVILRSEGHRVYTPTLTGLADRSHLLSADIGLQTHIDDIVNLANWEDLDDIVLCGHSYGGIVITGVVEKLRERVKALVYLDSIVPCGNGIVRVSALHDQVAVSVEMSVFHKDARVLCHAGSKHI